jgi:hypothetical protein
VCKYHEVVRDESTLRIDRLELELAALRHHVDSIGNSQHVASTSIPSLRLDHGVTPSNAIDAGLITWDQAASWYQRYDAPVRYLKRELNFRQLLLRQCTIHPNIHLRFCADRRIQHLLVPIFYETHDTVSFIASQSAFLFDAIVSIGCRAEEGPSSPTHRMLQSRLRDHLSNLLINSSTPVVEDVQAITLMAAYSENGFVMIALALRFAINLALPSAVDRLIAKCMDRSRVIGPDEQELFRLSRLWHGVCNLELLLDFSHLREIRWLPR